MLKTGVSSSVTKVMLCRNDRILLYIVSLMQTTHYRLPKYSNIWYDQTIKHHNYL